MKIAIIEDEPLALQRIQSIIKKNKPEYEVVKTAQSIKEVKSFLNNNPDVDLMLCDIHLADGLSFKAFQGENISFPLIFITAYDEYALQSFDHNCIDYVLKPIQEDRLLKAFDKWEQLVNEKKTSIPNHEFFESIIKNYQSKTFKKRFLTKTGSKFRFVSVEDIAYFYSEKGITYVKELGSANKYIVEHSLNELENELLDPYKFYRINRSVIVHLDGLVEMKPYHNGRMILSMDSPSELEIIVAREKVSEFKNWINQ